MADILADGRVSEINCKFGNGWCEIYLKIPVNTTQYPPVGRCGVAKMAILKRV
jgi:hypothetical protein